MSQYHKIQSIFKRDPETHRMIIGDYSMPEFEYLANNEWEFTEKVDGMNFRIMFDDEGNVTFGGKTDRAQLPKPLVGKLRERAADWPILTRLACADMVFYGEGYGPKIQKGGKYRDDQDFVLFDIRAGSWWLRRDSIQEIAQGLGLDVIPVVGHGTLDDAIKMVSAGLSSSWGDFEAEGIVARPLHGLRTRAGGRIIVKVKARDFRAQPGY